MTEPLKTTASTALDFAARPTLMVSRTLLKKAG